MAVCELGYLCEVCGADVADITESDLYLRYVLGEVDPETLHVSPERHIRCNPALAQFIVAEGFAPVVIAGPFGKAGLDPAFVRQEEDRVTRGYLRLKEIFATEGLPITEYPLPAPRSPRRRSSPTPSPGPVSMPRPASSARKTSSIPSPPRRPGCARRGCRSRPPPSWTASSMP